MTGIRDRLALGVVALLLCSLAASAQDYVRLKNGQIVPCAVLRQDTVAIFTTEWNLRSQSQPPLQVYTRDEVESIWFQKPEAPNAVHKLYVPRINGIEGGGSVAFQTWATTSLERRSLIQLSLHGGYSVLREFGLEAEADLSMPMQGRSIAGWTRNRLGHQVVINLAAYPFNWKGFIPFALLGGGFSDDIPVDNLILASDSDLRSVLDMGLGVKWGANGIGYRVEWRGNFYSWSPSLKVGQTVASPAQSADASIIRAGIFIYR